MFCLEHLVWYESLLFTLPQSSLLYTLFERAIHDLEFVRILYVLHLYLLSCIVFALVIRLYLLEHGGGSILYLFNTLETKESRKIVSYVYESVYAKYTAKMWGKTIDQLPKFILEGVKINLNKEWNYFPLDKYQALPVDG